MIKWSFGGFLLKIREPRLRKNICIVQYYVGICVQECESGLQVLESEVERVIENSGNEKNKAKLCRNLVWVIWTKTGFQEEYGIKVWKERCFDNRWWLETKHNENSQF